MKTKTYLSFVSLLLSAIVFSQSYTIEGEVRDDNNQPLPGVTVMVKDSNTGTTTDFDGKYALDVSKGGVILFAFVGFEEQSVIADGSTTINVTMQSGLSLDSIVVVGSRNPHRTAVDTAVPVDVVDITKLVSSGPQVNLNQILNYVAPSFTSNTQTISDGTDHIDPASLRGLGPDQVLVLINGKRRHTSSLINVNGTFGRGSVGTDLNAIPSAAIQRIEILRDGAAAQYGSDAIAGVINIVLRENTGQLLLNVTPGAQFSKNSNNQTGGMDGGTINVSANYGLKIGKNKGFLNFTGDFDVRDDYGRMKEFEGDIFNKYNTVERFADKDNYDLSKLLDDDVTDVIKYGNKAGFNLSATATKAELQTILKENNTSSELTARKLTKSDFNMRVGQSALRGGRFFANFSLPLDDNGTEVYSFSGISSRTGNSAGFYRLPNQKRTYTPAYINGFLPEINSTITDKSFAVGIRGKVSDWDVDFSNTWGKNRFLYTIGNTYNASMQKASPTTFDAGGFSFSQNTTNLDINKFHEDVFSGLNIAFGGEYRVETYEIFAGEEPSYTQYTAAGEIIKLDTQKPSVDFFGEGRPGGSQVFPGFSPSNELSRGRSSVAGYLDLEADFTESFLTSFATRYENYSDFGSTLNFKLATRIKVGENFNVRAAANTGFRAPSLHQLNFNSTATIFDDDGNPVEVGTFANDSRAAKLLGIPKLKEEVSKSVSLGITSKMSDANLTFTIDAYWVGINDRVIYTGSFKAKTGVLSNLLSQANAGAAAFFANAIDTETKGLDFVITHKAKFGSSTKFNTDLAMTFFKTEKVGNVKASKVLKDAKKVDTYFNESSRVYLEDAVPGTKINLTNSLTTDKFNIFLRNVYFGEVTEANNIVLRQQVFSSKIVTDLSFGYKASKSMMLTVGANNLFDIYPDRAAEKLSNRSSGRFDWSRRAQQFGVGGRFLFARISFTIK